MADPSEHQLAGRARTRRARPTSGSRHHTEGSRSSPRESESRSVVGIPQAQPAQHRCRRSEHLRALAREIALQRSRQGRHQTLQIARGRAKSQVDCAMPDAKHLHQSGTPTRRRAGPKSLKQVQPVRAIVRQAAAASSKAQRSVTLARKRREYTSDEAVERTPLTAGQNDSSIIDRAGRQPLDGKGQPGSSAGMPGIFKQVGSSSDTSPRTPPQNESPRRLATSWDSSPETPTSATAEQHASRFETSSAPALAELPSVRVPSTSESAPLNAPSAAAEQPSSTKTSEPQAMAPLPGVPLQLDNQKGPLTAPSPATELPASLSGTPSAQATAPHSSVPVQATIEDALSIEPTSMDTRDKDGTASASEHQLATNTVRAKVPHGPAPGQATSAASTAAGTAAAAVIASAAEGSAGQMGSQAPGQSGQAYGQPLAYQLAAGVAAAQAVGRAGSAVGQAGLLGSMAAKQDGQMGSRELGQVWQARSGVPEHDRQPGSEALRQVERVSMQRRGQDGQESSSAAKQTAQIGSGALGQPGSRVPGQDDPASREVAGQDGTTNIMQTSSSGMAGQVGRDAAGQAEQAGSDAAVQTGTAEFGAGQANGQVDNVVAGEIGQADNGFGGQANGQPQAGQQQPGTAGNGPQNEQPAKSSKPERGSWRDRRPFRSRITQTAETLAGKVSKLDRKQYAQRVLAQRSRVRGDVQGRIRPEGKRKRRVKFEAPGCSSLSIVTRQDDTTSTSLRARKAALCVHSILWERGGVAPGPEDELYSTFAEASELCQRVRNPREDWSHQMKIVTLPSAGNASMGGPVFHGLESEDKLFVPAC